MDGDAVIRARQLVTFVERNFAPAEHEQLFTRLLLRTSAKYHHRRTRAILEAANRPSPPPTPPQLPRPAPLPANARRPLPPVPERSSPDYNYVELRPRYEAAPTYHRASLQSTYARLSEPSPSRWTQFKNLLTRK